MKKLSWAKFWTAVRRLLKGAVVGVALLSIMGSGSLSPTFAQSRPFSLAISAFPAGAPSLPFLVGMARPELFARHGLELREKDIVPSLGGGEVMRNLALGKLDFGVGSTVAAVSAFQAGVPIQVIGSYGGGSIMWIVPVSSPIRSLKDAKGKKIAITSPTGTTRAAAALALQAIGLVGQAELIVAGSASASWAAVKRGAIDIAWANNLSATPLILSGEARSIGTISDYEPNFPDDFIIAGIPLIQKSPEVVRNFLKAYREIIDFIGKNPDVAVKVYAKAAKVDEAVARHAMSFINMKNFFDMDIKVDYLRTTQDAMRHTELLKSQFGEWKELINQEFLPGGVPRHTIPEKIPFGK